MTPSHHQVAPLLQLGAPNNTPHGCSPFAQAEGQRAPLSPDPKRDFRKREAGGRRGIPVSASPLSPSSLPAAGRSIQLISQMRETPQQLRETKWKSMEIKSGLGGGGGKPSLTKTNTNTSYPSPLPDLVFPPLAVLLVGPTNLPSRRWLAPAKATLQLMHTESSARTTPGKPCLSILSGAVTLCKGGEFRRSTICGTLQMGLLELVAPGFVGVFQLGRGHTASPSSFLSLSPHPHLYTCPLPLSIERPLSFQRE
ncbi:Hypothetical predicted protein [Podarcis lilfordi]|uniref:Uncharacterized protein n=1 Tax=Podarcis lilfordi TaxID=74358 RepID=A0AA35L979_9SAUR|nr:Hypothetical predicted protein [Podarcis lilfordi]